ncbi:MAG: FixH family protein [Firmicutes bacterium]|nr:FixH family protein [Bacillota bacterium]
MAEFKRAKAQGWSILRKGATISLAGLLLTGCGTGTITPSAASTVSTHKAVVDGALIEVTVATKPQALQEVPVSVIVHMDPTRRNVQVHRVDVSIEMTDMSMPPVKFTLHPKGAGRYAGHVIFTMSGPWLLHTYVHTQGATDEQTSHIQVG